MTELRTRLLVRLLHSSIERGEATDEELRELEALEAEGRVEQRPFQGDVHFCIRAPARMG